MRSLGRRVKEVGSQIIYIVLERLRSADYLRLRCTNSVPSTARSKCHIKRHTDRAATATLLPYFRLVQASCITSRCQSQTHSHPIFPSALRRYFAVHWTSAQDFCAGHDSPRCHTYASQSSTLPTPSEPAREPSAILALVALAAPSIF